MNSKHPNIITLLLMILVNIVTLSITAYATVIAPPTLSSLSTATEYRQLISQSLKPTSTPDLLPISVQTPVTTTSVPKSIQPPASTNSLPKSIQTPTPTSSFPISKQPSTTVTLLPTSTTSPSKLIMSEETTTSQPEVILSEDPTTLPSEIILSEDPTALPPELTPPEELTTLPQSDDNSLIITSLDAAVPLTPDGNLTLVDDISGAASEDKQFLTVTTKAGNIFYLFIDHAADKENVYFLNLVDEEDLLALIKNKSALEGVLVDSTNPNMTEPSGNPFSSPTSKETIKPVSTPEPATKESKQADRTTAYFALGVIILLLIAGGLVWFIKLRKPKKHTSTGSYLDEYDFGDEEDAVSNPDIQNTGTKNARDIDKLLENDYAPYSSKDGGMDFEENNTTYKNYNTDKNPEKQEGDIR